MDYVYLLEFFFDLVLSLIDLLHVFPSIFQLVIFEAISHHVLFDDAYDWSHLVMNYFSKLNLIIQSLSFPNN